MLFQPQDTGDGASMIAAAGVVRDLGKLIQIAASAIDVAPGLPDLRCDPVALRLPAAIPPTLAEEPGS